MATIIATEEIMLTHKIMFDKHSFHHLLIPFTTLLLRNKKTNIKWFSAHYEYQEWSGVGWTSQCQVASAVRTFSTLWNLEVVGGWGGWVGWTFFQCQVASAVPTVKVLLYKSKMQSNVFSYVHSHEKRINATIPKCLIRGYMCNNKFSIQIEGLEDRKLF